MATFCFHWIYLFFIGIVIILNFQKKIHFSLSCIQKSLFKISDGRLKFSPFMYLLLQPSYLFQNLFRNKLSLAVPSYCFIHLRRNKNFNQVDKKYIYMLYFFGINFCLWLVFPEMLWERELHPEVFLGGPLPGDGLLSKLRKVELARSPIWLQLRLKTIFQRKLEVRWP